MQSDPLGAPLENKARFDLIIASFCLTAGCHTEADYKLAWKRLATLLSPGGVLIVTEPLEESWNEVGGTTFKVLSITADHLKESINDAGFHVIKHVQEIYTPGWNDGNDPDKNKWHFTVTKKM